MKLPNSDEVLVERKKVVDYLLNLSHRFGSAKARFFIAYGFQPDAWETLASALRTHGASHDVSNVIETGFGSRYEIDGELIAPDGRRPRIRTIWQLDETQLAPRLITAYPLDP